MRVSWNYELSERERTFERWTFFTNMAADYCNRVLLKENKLPHELWLEKTWDGSDYHPIIKIMAAVLSIKEDCGDCIIFDKDFDDSLYRLHLVICEEEE